MGWVASNTAKRRGSNMRTMRLQAHRCATSNQAGEVWSMLILRLRSAPHRGASTRVGAVHHAIPHQAPFVATDAAKVERSEGVAQVEQSRVKKAIRRRSRKKKKENQKEKEEEGGKQESCKRRRRKRDRTRGRKRRGEVQTTKEKREEEEQLRTLQPKHQTRKRSKVRIAAARWARDHGKTQEPCSSDTRPCSNWTLAPVSAWMRLMVSPPRPMTRPTATRGTFTCGAPVQTQANITSR